MIKIWRLICLALGLVGGLNAAVAQDSTDLLSGYWKQKGASVYIKIVNSDGVYEAEMVRNDWTPGLVGGTVFNNVVLAKNKNNRWVGDATIAGGDRVGKATLRINASGELKSRLRPGGNATWVRTEPVEKRY